MTPSSRKHDDRSDIHDHPWVSLVYLCFVFVPLAFWRDHPPSAIYASLAACALFLPLHLRFHRTQGGEQTWLWLPVALLGFALLPFNPGGNTFLIYAFAMLGVSQPTRRAITISLGLWLLLAIEFVVTLPTLELAASYIVILTIIGAMVLGGVIYERLRERRNAELRLTQEEVRRLATMAERERIGRDLHDLLGHTLSVIVLKSELAGKLLDRDAAGARQQIADVEQVARQALAEVREAVAGIRASGLEAELAAARLALLSAGVHLDQRLAPASLAPDAESALALALREAITNVLRHAEATRVDVELQALADGVLMRISDDGRGGAILAGNGLTGMRERLAALGGALGVDSDAGSGTRLELRLPATALARTAT